MRPKSASPSAQRDDVVSDLARFRHAIDLANASDPNRFYSEALAQAQGRIAERWVTYLDPGAAEALRIAARAHHLRRWSVPRDSYPEGREGYLRWRRDQKVRHADELRGLLEQCDAPSGLLDRACEIVQKKRLGTDLEVQTFQDAVSLTFIETQFVVTAEKLGDEARMTDVLAKTLAKMSSAARVAARTIELDDWHMAVLRRAAILAVR
jgi:hypothetical protein